MNNKNNWFIDKGQVPSLQYSWPLYGIKLASSISFSDDVYVSGHTSASDGTYHYGANFYQTIPLSPLYAKDLSGRIIYLGYGPEFKTEEDWKVQKDIFFPRFCESLAYEALEQHGIEEQFFTTFRGLEASLSESAIVSGMPEDRVALRYKNPNLYPYKLRLDTFYADGWKIPQTQYLYVKSEGVTLTETESVAADFWAKWDGRSNLNYEQWYEKYDGESWFESLFEKGVTVIPTVEAFNGYNKVSKDFDLEDFWPGRAVAGLHKVVGMEPSEAPKGTILEVKRPGLAMSRRIEPAQVIVSDGSHYLSPHAEDPEPHLPDLRLPHTRCIAEWGACHLPTHPRHFEEPALWGWDKKTGKFMQLSGPLWDPLHYYYKSVDNVVKAFKNPSKGDPEVVPIPDEMKLKFYPISVMNGYDVIDENTFNARRNSGIAINSSIRRKPLAEESSTLGYHPLPIEIEYELDNWVLPELAPKHRLSEPTPSPNISRRLLPVIRSNVSPSYYAKEVEGQKPWLSDNANLKIATGRALEDYPFLARYLGNETDLDKISKWVNLHLEHISDDLMQSSAHQLWSDDRSDDFDRQSPGIYTALMDMRSTGLDIMRMRHRLYRENRALYYAAFWNMSPLEDVLVELNYLEHKESVQNKVEGQNTNEQYLLDESNLKSSELGGSLDEDGSF